MGIIVQRKLLLAVVGRQNTPVNFTNGNAYYIKCINALIKVGCFVHTFKDVLTATNPKLPLGCTQPPIHV